MMDIILLCILAFVTPRNKNCTSCGFTCPESEGIVTTCEVVPGQMQCYEDSECKPEMVNGQSNTSIRLPPPTCPESEGIVTTCEVVPGQMQCYEDSECKPDEKCCSYGCGGRSRCFKKANSTDTRPTRPKPPVCPESEGIITTCDIVPGQMLCYVDSECDKGERCCSYGCGGRSRCFKKFADKDLPPCWQSLNLGHLCWCTKTYSWTTSRVSKRWYYNTSKRRCVPFRYKGCGGNKNNFLSKRTCLNKCSSKNLSGR